jgi:hypothetical protein
MKIFTITIILVIGFVVCFFLGDVQHWEGVARVTFILGYMFMSLPFYYILDKNMTNQDPKQKG